MVVYDECLRECRCVSGNDFERDKSWFIDSHALIVAHTPLYKENYLTSNLYSKTWDLAIEYSLPNGKLNRLILHSQMIDQRG